MSCEICPVHNIRICRASEHCGLCQVETDEELGALLQSKPVEMPMELVAAMIREGD